MTDIEGTTSSISFVHEVLFPYAASRLPTFMRGHHEDDAVALQLDEVARLGAIERDDVEALIAQLLDWIASDTKATPLKALQGMIWIQGYERGDYTAHFYADAVEKLRNWHARGRALYVYSSGSVQAQKLFFQYSEFGDLRPLVSGYFDTTTGAKGEAASYRRIQAELSLPAGDILFLSDVNAELDAAAESGWQTIRLARPQDAPIDAGDTTAAHRVVLSFDDIGL